MNKQNKKIVTNLAIILCPILIIMYLLSAGLTDTATLGTWDIAISIGAMVTVLIYLFKDKRK